MNYYKSLPIISIIYAALIILIKLVFGLDNPAAQFVLTSIALPAFAIVLSSYVFAPALVLFLFAGIYLSTKDKNVKWIVFNVISLIVMIALTLFVYTYGGSGNFGWS